MYRNSNIFRIFLAVAVLLSLTVSMVAAVPVTQNITYQGKLTDAAGIPITGTPSVTFKLYEVASGGSAIATDTHTVTAAKGLFTTQITADSKLFDGRALWLGIKVGADAEMMPRQELRPVPYALSLRPGAWITGTTVSSALNLQNKGGGIGLNVSTTGTNSPAVRAITFGDASNAVWGSTSGNGPAAIVGTTTGKGSLGVYAYTSGEGAQGVLAYTSGKGSDGVEASTTGAGSRAVYAHTTNASSNGIEVDTLGYQSYGVSANTGGDESTGVDAGTEGDSSDGVFAHTTGDQSSGVRTQTSGVASYGVDVETKGRQSYGINVDAKGDHSGGVFVHTHGIYSDGVNAQTYGSDSRAIYAYTHLATNSDGVDASTSGANSRAVFAHTTNASSDGIDVKTEGVNSHGLNAQTYNTDSYGVYAYSAQGTAIWADTGRSDQLYGVQTPDYMKAARYDTVSKDVAEYMPVSGDVAPGTVLVIGKGGILAPSSATYDTHVAGIVSTEPGVTLGIKEGGNYGEALIAVSGRVPCKVDASNGAILEGDLLTTSDRPGYAMKAEPTMINGRGFYPDGTILGKAMGTLESGTGTIEVLVTLQ